MTTDLPFGASRGKKREFKGSVSLCHRFSYSTPSPRNEGGVLFYFLEVSLMPEVQ